MEWIAHPLLRLLYLGISMGCFFWLLSSKFEKNGLTFLAILGIVVGQLCFLVPAYCYGDAEIWELWVLAIGIVCCLAELILPGIGFFGIGGAILFFGGAILVQVPNQGYDFSMVGSDQWAASISVIGTILVLSLAALLVLNKYIASSSFIKPFSQSHTLSNQKGYEAHHNQDLVGKEGLAFTVLRPSGKIMIEGKHYSGMSESEWIDKGVAVKVTGVSGGIYIVKAIA